MTRSIPRFNTRVLTVFLLTALPGLVIGVIVVLALAQARLSESAGRHLEDVARHTAANVDAYVFRRILDVSVLARTPDLRQAAATASARPFDRAAAEALSRSWQQSPATPQAAALMTSAASRYLVDLVAHGSIYREVVLTDRHGQVVAASSAPTTLLQSDQDWWRAAVDDGQRGRVSVSDVHWDPEARVYAMSIAVPVHTPDSEHLVGILRVIADGREMLAAVGNVQMGQTGSAWLLRRNGSVVFSRTTTDPNARFWAAEQVRARMEALAGSESIGGASFGATGPGNRTWVVGVAESQLRTSYPSLGWVVAVSQAREEVLAPVGAVGWYLLTLLALMAIFVLALALYFSMRLAAPLVDVDLPVVEHPAVSHVGEESEEPANV